ncbi:c-type cytochrome biogenesis protein CcsB [bacterium]|nr:c-type cytochrome biogenesis protein CcsB [bacterium]
MSATRVFFNVAEVAYLAAVLVFAVYYASHKKGFRAVAISFLIAGGLSQAFFVGWRWVEGERPPFANSFETLVFFSLAIAVTCIIVELLYSPKAVGAGASLLALLAMAYANLFDWAIDPLMPALQNSLWLTLHVVFCFVSYAAFAVSYVVASVFLLKQKGVLRKVSAFLTSLSILGLVGGLVYGLGRKHGIIPKVGGRTTIWLIAAGFVVAGLLSAALVAVLNARGVRSEGKRSVLSILVSKTIAFGFPFLTIGIITGSVWANVAWGRYWGWDPKETWSLITWVVYAFFLHVRFSGGWLGVKAKSLPTFRALLSMIGFLFVLFTYFGVNYLLSGLHAYGD